MSKAKIFPKLSGGNSFLFFNRFLNVRFSGRCHFILTASLLEKSNVAIFDFFAFVLPHKNKCINVFMWVKIYSIPVCINFCLIASVYTHMGSEGPPTARYCNFHHLRGNESWQVMSKFVHFTSVHFPDLNQNSCNNLNNVKSDLRIH